MQVLAVLELYVKENAASGMLDVKPERSQDL